MIVFLCHDCGLSTDPIEGMSAGLAARCSRRCDHYIRWRSPEEDAAAILTGRVLALAAGGRGGDSRAAQALVDCPSAPSKLPE